MPKGSLDKNSEPFGVWSYVWSTGCLGTDAFFFLPRNIPDGVVAVLTGADADGILQFGDENLAVTEFAGAQDAFTGGEHRGHGDFGNHGFDFDFWHEFDIVFLAAVDFLMAFGEATAEDLTHGDAHDADAVEGAQEFIEFGGTGDDFDFGQHGNHPFSAIFICMTVLASISLEVSKEPKSGLEVSTPRV